MSSLSECPEPERDNVLLLVIGLTVCMAFYFADRQTARSGPLYNAIE